MAASRSPAPACSSIRTKSASAAHQASPSRVNSRSASASTAKASAGSSLPMASTASRVVDSAARNASPSSANSSRLCAAAAAHAAAGCTMHAPGRAATASACSARARAAGEPPGAAASMAATRRPPSGSVAKYQYQPSAATSRSPASGSLGRVRGAPGQGGVDVVALGGQPGQPPGLAVAAQLRLRLLGQGGEVADVRPGDPLGLAGLGQPLGCVLADGLQQVVARAGVAVDHDQGPVDQPGQRVHGRPAGPAAAIRRRPAPPRGSSCRGTPTVGAAAPAPAR